MLSPLSSENPQRDLVDNNYRVLQLAETRGKTVDNWRRGFAEKTKEFTESEELQEAFEKKAEKAQKKAQKIEERKQEQEERKEEVDGEKVQEVVEELEFDLDKGKITAEIKTLRKSLKSLGHEKANKETQPARVC